MPNRGLAVLAGVAGGLEDTVNRIHTLQLARYKLDQEKEVHDADLKIKKAELGKMEVLYGPEQVAAEREKLKAETSAQSALFNLRTLQIGKEQEKYEREAESHQKAMLILDNALKKGGKLPQGMRINSKGDFSMSGQKEELDISALLNEDSGGIPGNAKPPASQDWWNQ